MTSARMNTEEARERDARKEEERPQRQPPPPPVVTISAIPSSISVVGQGCPSGKRA